jgi:hypothetical protein
LWTADWTVDFKRGQNALNPSWKNSDLIFLSFIYSTINIASRFMSLPFFLLSCFSLPPVFSPLGVFSLKIYAGIPSTAFNTLSGVGVQAPFLAYVISFSLCVCVCVCVCVSEEDGEGNDSQFLRVCQLCMAVFERKVLA